MELILTGIGMLILGFGIGLWIGYEMSYPIKRKYVQLLNDLEIFSISNRELRESTDKLVKEFKWLYAEYLKLSGGKLPEQSKDLNTSINEMNKHADK